MAELAPSVSYLSQRLGMFSTEGTALYFPWNVQIHVISLEIGR
jgi:hypothetical protein